MIFYQKKLFILLLIQSFIQVEASDLNKDIFLSKLNFPDKKGELPHPIVNSLIRKLNLKKNLNRDLPGFKQKGYFYKVNQREKVQVIAIGRVVFSSFIKNYGPTLIVDHGRNYYSIYGNLEKVFAKKGSLVRAGEVIGCLGREHLQFRMGLYFEIRHFSKSLNPDKWLKLNSFVRGRLKNVRYEVFKLKPNGGFPNKVRHNEV